MKNCAIFFKNWRRKTFRILSSKNVEFRYLILEITLCSKTLPYFSSLCAREKSRNFPMRRAAGYTYEGPTKRRYCFQRAQIQFHFRKLDSKFWKLWRELWHFGFRIKTFSLIYAGMFIAEYEFSRPGLHLGVPFQQK